MALYHCTYQWPREFGKEQERTPEQALDAFRKIFREAEASNPFGERMRAWYGYAGEWAGVLIVEAGSVEELHQLLLPYSQLMNWTVKPIVNVDYQASRQNAGIS